MSHLDDLTAARQSVRYHCIRRTLLDSGKLASFLDPSAVTRRHVQPDALERAIAGDADHVSRYGPGVGAVRTQHRAHRRYA